MGFNFISARRCAKTKRTPGKVDSCCVYGWLLLMAVLAGQVGAQGQDCPATNDAFPPCNFRIDPSPTCY